MGWLGVSFFFVLSGFLITRILIESKSGNNFFSNFYIRRSLRIFPLYYLYILVIFIYCTYLGIQDTQNWLYYIFYVQNYTMAWNGFMYVPGQEFGHTWSLAVEEQFYLLWPLVVFFCNRKWIFISAIILSCVAIASRFYLAEYTSIVSFAPLYLGYGHSPYRGDNRCNLSKSTGDEDSIVRTVGDRPVLVRCCG